MATLKNVRIAFLGAGNMAEAMIAGLLREGLTQADHIRITDLVPERRDFMAQTYQVGIAESNTQAVASSDVVILAVKPQGMGELLAEVQTAAAHQPLFISIAAGITVSFLEKTLPAQARVIRCMPNTPALIGAGMTAICAGHAATAQDLILAENILAATGQVVRVEEAQMDAVTAVSGSGPAYAFYLMEAMIDAAERMGLDPELARTLVKQTVSGAAALAHAPDAADPSELRQRVTSKGGTTAAAIAAMDAENVRDHLITAILAAQERARELAAELER